MGFFDALSKMAAGKPVFEAPQQQQPGQPPQEAGQQPGQPQQSGPKERPVVVIERVECRPNGPNMEVSLTFQNNSQSSIMLDKIMFMNTSREIDTVLTPGQEREFVGLYNGPRPNHRNYNTATLQYHEGGDYFQALFTVEFNQEQDNTYTITRFRLQLPIKDI